MRVLVTGATGFAGRWLLSELVAAGHTASALPTALRLDSASASHDLVAVLDRIKPEAIAHLAGVAFLPDAEANPQRAYRVNVGGTQALLDALDANGSGAPVLITSSVDVYAPTARVPTDETGEVGPSTAYGRSKLAQEEVARRAARGGRRIAIVRAFNHIGPGQRPEFVVPALARRVLEMQRGQRSSIPVGNLSPRRDFTDVRDVVRAYRLLLEILVDPTTSGTRSILVNLGSGRSTSIEDVLRTLCELAGVEPRWELDPDRVRQNDVQDRCADTTQIRTLTGWAATIPLRTSLWDVLAATGRYTSPV